MRVLIPTAAVGFAVAGCGGSVINGPKAEAFLQRTLTPKPKSVSCPNGVAAKKGGTVKCKVVFGNGDTGAVTLHETNNTGHVTFNLNDLRATTIGAAAARTVVTEWASGRRIALASLSCPSSTPVTVGGTINCEVVDRTGKKATIGLQIVDQRGSMRVSRVQPHG